MATLNQTICFSPTLASSYQASNDKTSAFPVPMDFTSSDQPPAYPSDMNPFSPRGLPEGDVKESNTLKSDDLVPDHYALSQLNMSIKEIKDCKAVFDGLVEGIEKRHKYLPMDQTERALQDKVLALQGQSESVLCACTALHKNTLSFFRKFIKKLDEVSDSQVRGVLFPDEELRKCGNELLQVSRDMSKHVKTMLERLKELAEFVRQSKDSGKRHMRKKIWDWLVRAFTALRRIFLSGASAVVAPAHIIIEMCVSKRAASICSTIKPDCNEEDGFTRVLEFLQEHIPEAAVKAEEHLSAFLAHQLVFRTPLGVGSVKEVVWMASDEASRARNELYRALVSLDT